MVQEETHDGGFIIPVVVPRKVMIYRDRSFLRTPPPQEKPKLTIKVKIRVIMHDPEVRERVGRRRLFGHGLEGGERGRVQDALYPVEESW